MSISEMSIHTSTLLAYFWPTVASNDVVSVFCNLDLADLIVRKLQCKCSIHILYGSIQHDHLHLGYWSEVSRHYGRVPDVHVTPELGSVSARKLITIHLHNVWNIKTILASNRIEINHKTAPRTQSSISFAWQMNLIAVTYAYHIPCSPFAWNDSSNAYAL